MKEICCAIYWSRYIWHWSLRFSIPFEETPGTGSGFAKFLNYNLNIEITKGAALTVIVDPATGDEIKVQGAQLNTEAGLRMGRIMAIMICITSSWKKFNSLRKYDCICQRTYWCKLILPQNILLIHLQRPNIGNEVTDTNSTNHGRIAFWGSSTIG